MLVKKVEEIYSEEDLKTLKGEYFDDGWIHELIDEDCDIDGQYFRTDYNQNES